MPTKNKTNWGALQRESSDDAHKRQIDALTQQLTQTQATLERTIEARRVKFKAAPRPSGRQTGDIVRVSIHDTHGMHADPKAISALIADLKVIDPDEIILLGDIVDCGGFLAQHHVMGYVAETAYSYEQDIEASNALLDAIQQAAPRAKIEYVEGNHEKRVETWAVTATLRHSRDSEALRRLYAPEFRLNLKARGIPYYRMSECYDGLTVPGFIKRGKLFYTHGSFITSKHATAAIHAKVAGNVRFANTHRAQAETVYRVGVGFIGAYNAGCACLKGPLWRNTDPTEWSDGYGLDFIAPSQSFLALNVPILDGVSHFSSLFKL